MPNAYNGPFAATLQDLDEGRLHAELTDALSEVVAQVMQQGKAGKLTLSLTIKPAARRSDAVVVGASIAKKLPEPDRPESLFFATDDGGLSRRNPKQPELPGVLRPVATEEQ